MQRRKPLTRKTPLRGNPEKTREWKNRSRQELPKFSDRRRTQTATYRGLHGPFLRAHKVCPLSGLPTSEVHHSARRQGEWLNLQRYWIAVHPLAHKWIEEHSGQSEKANLMTRLRPSETYEDHMLWIANNHIDPNEPVYYKFPGVYAAELEICRKAFKEWVSKSDTDR